MATLRDVAALAGVHPSIVSRVLNGDKSASVKEETRERVLKAAQALGYRPNALARGLKLRSAGSLALVIPDVSNPVYAEIIRGAEQEARQEGCHLLLASTEGTDPAKLEFLSVLLEGRVDGLIVASALVEDEVIDALEAGNHPYVLVNRRSHRASRYVVADDGGGAKMAVAYLVSLGHRRIGHLAGPQFTDTALERALGYRKALEAAGIPYDPELVIEGDFSTEAGRVGVQRLLALSRPPTAVFATNLRVAAGALDQARRLGVRVPEEFSLIALHDSELAELVTPGITTVRLPLERMGREAVRMLLRLVRGQAGPTQMVIPGRELVLRGTVAPPPAR